jgi:hypothetical protein
MNREQLEHLIRAAGDVLGETEIIVIGSQAILASFPHAALPAPLVRSSEADLLPVDDPTGEKADLIDARFGEFSHFQESFGIYGDGVSRTTARLPDRWEERLIPYENENTNGVTGWCLEKHDLCVAKLFAGREKDYDFVGTALREGLVDAGTVLERMERTDLDAADLQRMAAVVHGAIGGPIRP